MLLVRQGCIFQRVNPRYHRNVVNKSPVMICPCNFESWEMAIATRQTMVPESSHGGNLLIKSRLTCVHLWPSISSTQASSQITSSRFFPQSSSTLCFRTGPQPHSLRPTNSGSIRGVRVANVRPIGHGWVGLDCLIGPVNDYHWQGRGRGEKRYTNNLSSELTPLQPNDAVWCHGLP